MTQEHACVCCCTCWNMRAAQLPFVWRIRPLLLFLCPPAALCCQVEPEGLALITAKRLTVTLTQDVAVASSGRAEQGTPRSLLPHSETMRAIADHLLPLPSQKSQAQGQITLCVCMWVKAASSSPLLSYSTVTLLFLPLGPMLTHLPFRKMGHSSSGPCKNIYKLN